jgi:hypothetical protein
MESDDRPRGILERRSFGMNSPLAVPPITMATPYIDLIELIREFAFAPPQCARYMY